MVLVDTSIWVDHLRKGEQKLIHLLQEDLVVIHPTVIEELACGNMTRHSEVLDLLEALPKAPQASHAEFLNFVSQHALNGVGLGAVDVHLLASARLARAQIWSRDKTLCQTAKRLHVLAPQD